MESNKKQTIFMSVIGVATLLVAVIGATFAYFTIQVSGNNTASSITITTADVAAVTFTDGAAITVANAYPGYSKSKTFTVKTTGGDANSQIGYIIQLVTSNGALATAATNSKEFNYSLSGTKTGSGTVATAVTKADMPSSGTTNIGTGTLKGNETHTYTFTVELQERGSAQDYLQGKTYAGKIQISLATTEGNRTWDETTSGWKKYTGN